MLNETLVEKIAELRNTIQMFQEIMNLINEAPMTSRVVGSRSHLCHVATIPMDLASRIDLAIDEALNYD